MNKKQRIILSVAVTLILFVIAYSCSTSIKKSYGYTYPDGYVFDSWGTNWEARETTYVNVEFYELQYNWYVWILFIIVSGGFNYKLFSDKKQRKKKN